MSWAGMPSVMQMTSSMPESAASRMASAAKGAGTKMREVLALVRWTASSTVLNTGTDSSHSMPPRPGVTPATTWVPYSMQRLVCSDPLVQ